MVFDGPGFRAGRVFRPLASLVDVPPTLLAACGLHVPGKMQGRNLVPLLDAPDIQPDEVFIQISESEVARAVRTPRWKYSAVAPGKGGSRESGSDRYVDECLYDLSADPFEQHNLVGLSAYTDVLAELRRRLAARMVDAGEPQPVIGPPSA